MPAGGEEAPSEEQPDFLPMFQWFTGTSADMYRTIAGLIISVKVFLGRFDMRTMQVRSSTGGVADQAYVGSIDLVNDQMTKVDSL